MSPSAHNGPKLPAEQLAILAVVRFAEPLALTSVFPYLPEMIKSFGVPHNNVAKWAGMVGSTFSISQSLCAVPWGRLSDKIGRKPTILMGLINVMFCFLLWGTSTSLVQAFAARFLMGLGNGNVGIIRTMVAEMVPWKELQPRAFSLMPLVWSIGSVFGPSFGGFFARPAQQYPALFGNSWLFNKYPFLLPNLVACIFFLFSVVVAFLYLHETLETKRHDRDWGLDLGEKISRSLKRKPRHAGHRRHHRASFIDAEASAPLLPKSAAVVVRKANSSSGRSSKDSDATPPPTMREIFTPQVTINIVAYTILALHAVAFDQVLPAFLDYPRQNPDEAVVQLPFHFSGGFGLNSSEIGTLFTVYGFACGVIQFFVFPPLCSRFGALNCFKAGTILYPIFYLLVPYTALIRSPTIQYACLLALLLVKGFAGIVGFPCITILLTNSAPTLRILGTLNGFATTFSGIGRAIGPTSAGAIFSWGVKRGSVVPAFWFLALVALGQVIPAWMIVESDGPRSDETDEEELEDDEISLDTDEEDEHAADVMGAGREDAVLGVDEDGFSPLVRVNSRASKGSVGYGTIRQ
ncbi:MFS general substrate transporter [Cryphonectria parasitica EP155]|uniref:MFS general substrate transporter n=1 Tax=Cryphonectria parasitica (strain ATCC 38755 / EP155) TaxID=660469 RepID=A0A9P5CNM9_CRYP1|nr:MFS general substrate transporter [Cryphonectria parasitica EP155]KAF3764492.1 MFS general substrate transporter [Cryphonectria parasitica EP155]